jgi:hypothetical protein
MRLESGAIAQVNLCAGTNGPFDSLNVYGDAGFLALGADSFPADMLTAHGIPTSRYYRPSLRVICIVESRIRPLNAASPMPS